MANIPNSSATVTATVTVTLADSPVSSACFAESAQTMEPHRQVEVVEEDGSAVTLPIATVLPVRGRCRAREE